MERLRLNRFSTEAVATPFRPERDVRKLHRRLRIGWEHFLGAGDVPPDSRIRSVVVERWRAARERGIDPFLAAVPVMNGAKETEEPGATEFARAGRRVVDDMAEVLADEGHAILLADVQGRILHVGGHPDVIEALGAINARPGGLWNEEVAGPNGIGTALACQSPVFVFGPEHFCEAWHEWICSGAPVKDPSSGAVLGAVNVSSRMQDTFLRQLPVAASMARSIEYLLAESQRFRRQALSDAWRTAESRWPLDAVGVFDRAGNVVHANRRWHELAGRLGASWTREPAISELLESPRPDRTVRITVSSSEARIAVVRGIQAEGEAVGALVVLERHGPVWGRSRAAERTPGRHLAYEGLLGRDPEFQSALAIAARAAAGDEPVLILGETGTGKELVATAIHRSGRRSQKPLVSVNCAALPRDLMESELFGYEGGAFSGARREGKVGRFELANGGTLFLDEVGELPRELQAKLLRALEEKTVFRVGGTRARPIDVRIIGATNRDLAAAVDGGEFRQDLFYRLNVIEISLPPLRARGRDVLELAQSFLAASCQRLGRPLLRLAPEVEAVFLRYRWPGNARELRNVIARLVTLLEGDVVSIQDLPAALREATNTVRVSRRRSLWAAEEDLIREAIQAEGGNISEAARRLGIDRSTVYRHLRRS